MTQTNHFSTSYNTIESIRPVKEAQLVNASSDSSSRQVGCGYESEFRVTSKPSAQTESITTTHCHSPSPLSTHKPHLTIDTNKQSTAEHIINHTVPHPGSNLFRRYLAHRQSQRQHAERLQCKSADCQFTRVAITRGLMNTTDATGCIVHPSY